jgi:hypothetical protein
VESGLGLRRSYKLLATGCAADQPDEKPGVGVASRAGASLTVTDDDGVSGGLLQLLVASRIRESKILGKRPKARAPSLQSPSWIQRRYKAVTDDPA